MRKAAMAMTQRFMKNSSLITQRDEVKIPKRCLRMNSSATKNAHYKDNVSQIDLDTDFNDSIKPNSVTSTYAAIAKFTALCDKIVFQTDPSTQKTCPQR